MELKDRVFKLQVGRPVQFPIYSTTADRVERPGEVVPMSEDLQALPPIHTILKSGKDRVERIPVYLRARLTEIGTVELWCAAAESREQWQLEFAIRGATEEPKMLATESLPSNYQEAKGWIELIYGSKPKPQPGSPGPKDAKQLWSWLERTLGSREQWPLALLRQIWTDLFAHANKRRRSASHERIYPQPLFVGCFQVLQGSRRADHLVGSLGLSAFRFGDIFRLDGGNAYSEIRLEIRPERFLVGRLKAAGNTAPENPELVPVRFLLVKLDPVFKQAGTLLCAPFVQWRSESRTE